MGSLGHGHRAGLSGCAGILDGTDADCPVLPALAAAARLFQNEHAAQHLAELAAHERDHGDEGVAQGVLDNDGALAEALGPGGADDPFFVQFFNYLKNIVTKFDFGFSWVNRKDVVGEISSPGG